jgi:hypothetical protein
VSARRLLKLFLPVALAVTITAAALAYFTSSGTGSAAAGTGSISSPGAPNVPAASNASVPLSWSASSFSPSNPTLDNDIAYTVQRSSNGGSTWGTPAGTCSGTIASGTSCTDTAAEGTYVYRVIAHFHNWTATSAASDEVDVDDTDPTVQSITATGSSPTKALSVQYTVTFSEPVEHVDSGDFAVTQGGGVSGAGVSNVTGSGASRTVTVSTGIGDGTVRLDLNDNGTIEDSVGNPLAGGFTSGDVYAIDKTAPNVSSINRVGSSPTNASSVQFTVTFDESVIGVDEDDFAPSTTGGITGAGVTSVTGTGATRTVTVSTGSGSGTIGLDLDNDGSITDIATNPLAGGDFTTGQTYTIDRAAPTVVSIDRQDPSPTKAGSVDWTVTFSEGVTGVDSADFALAATGVSGESISGVSGSGSSYTVTANTGSGSGSLGLNLAGGATVADGVGNGLATGFTGEIYTLDRTAPVVQSITQPSPDPTDASSVDFLVTFSEGVTGVNAADFAITGSGLSGTSIGPISGTGSTRTVTVNTGTGDGTLGINLVDDDSIVDGVTNPLGGAGAGNGNFAGPTYTVDKSDPVVSSINLDGPTPTKDATVSWTVTFSEAVTGVDDTDFDLVPSSGVSSSSITSVTGTGASRTVTANSGSGSGTLRLDLVDNDTIVDVTGRNLNGTGLGNGNFTGQTYTIDKTAPALFTLEMFDDSANGKVDRVVATFDGALAPYTAGTAPWTLTQTPSGGSLSSVSVTGSEATLTIAEGTESPRTDVGNFKVSLAPNSNGIRDSLGNPSSFGPTAPADKARPIPISIADNDSSAGGNGLAQAGDIFFVNFSEDVTNSVTSTNVVIQGGANASATDTLSMPGVLGLTTNMGGNDYVNGNSRNAIFNNSAVATAPGGGLSVTLSTCTSTSSPSGCSGANANSQETSAANFAFTPANTITDLFSNIATGIQTQSVRLF